MTQKQTYGLMALGLVGVGVVLAIVLMFGSRVFGASINRYEAGVVQFGNGIYAGLLQEFSIDSSGAMTSATTTNSTSYWTVGGIDYASVQVSTTATSSAPCDIPNPFGSATSTVLNHIVHVTANGLGAQSLDVSTSSSAYGSTSPAFMKLYSAGAGQFTAVWTPGIASTSKAGVLGYDTYSSAGNSPYILGPSEHLTTRIATGTAGTFSSYYTGTCSGTFMKP